MAQPHVSSVAVALAALLVAPAPAQEVLVAIEPTMQGQEFGDDAAFVGDENGDGVPEVALADHFASRVVVFDGAYGDVRHVLSFEPFDGFGSDADGGELDGDGLADIAAGYWSIDGVRLLSGLDGHQIKGYAKISKVLEVVGDVDGDGLDDLAVGDDHQTSGTQVGGLVRVFSSASGDPYYEDWGEDDDDRLGMALAALGDLDGDGVPDVAYGAPGEGDGTTAFNDFGAVYAGTVGTGQVLWKVAGVTAMAGLGSALAPAGDVDLDGVPDLIVGAGGGIATVRVLSGVDGTALSLAPQPLIQEGFATAVASAGDMNADGRPDVAVGAPLAPGGGRVDFFDGATGAPIGSLLPLEALPGWAMGEALDGPADVNADGIADLVVGMPDTSFPWADGRALLASTRDVPWQHLGHALAGADGDPLLRVEGVPRSDTKVVLKLAGGPAGGFAWLVLGAGANEIPLLGGVLVPDLGVQLPEFLDAAGRAVFTGRWPVVPPGVELTFQAWLVDASGPAGWTASNALAAQPVPGG